MKAVELRKKSTTELTKEIVKWREQAATLVRSRGVEDQQNVRQLRLLRKDIARALTVLSEKKRQEAS